MTQANQQQRQFDWGPPVQTGEGLKEWFVYLIIVAVLSLGIWLLLDIKQKQSFTATEGASEIVAVDEKLERVVTDSYNKEAPKATEKSESLPAKARVVHKVFFVQIGAFGDEPSANEIYDLLKKEGIEARLLRPDDQFEIYRLVVGPFDSEKMAEDKAEQLNAIDFPCFVVEAE